MQPNTLISTPFILTLLTLTSPFLQAVTAAKPASLDSTTTSSASTKTTSLAHSSETDTTDSTNPLSGSLDSSSWSSTTDTSTASTSAAAKSQWIEINTPMGKITTCSTIMISWSSGGVSGPFEIDVVSATSGDVITIDSNIDLTNQTSYKWLVAVPADTYYFQGNAADLSYLVYSGNFTVSKGTTTCQSKDTVSGASASASGNAAVASVTVSATPSSGATFNSGAERIMVSGASVVGLVIIAAFCL